MKPKFNFFLSIPYLIILSLSTLAFWYFGLEKIGIPVFLALIFILFLASRNQMPVVAVLFNALFMISQTEWSIDTIPLYLYIAPIVLIVGFIAHVIIYKVKLFRGDLTLGIVLMILGIGLSAINTEVFNIQYGFLMLVALFYGFVYFFFTNTIKGDNTKFLIKLFVVLGLLISVQILIYYLRVDDVVFALEHKTIDLGWGISNFVATYLIMFISAMVYFAKKYKMHFIWIIISFFEIIMLLFTLSRGGIIAFFVTSIFLLVYMFVGYEHKYKLLINIVIALALVGLFIYIKPDYLATVWDRLSHELLDDNGRYEIWQLAITKFKAHPLFGAGLFSRLVGEDYLGLFHNTVFNTAAWFGVVGLLALLVMFLQVLKVFFYKFNSEKAILLIALAGANIHGMVDNIFYMPQFMIIFLIIMAVVENANKEVVLNIN